MIQTNNTLYLTRSNLWSNQLKEVLEEELMGMKYVDMITDFPDGDTLNIPSIGRPEVYDYEEGQAVTYSSIDTGNFTFTITDYKASAQYITRKAEQDMFYADRLKASFVPGQQKALMRAIETDILAIGPNGQTASNTNTINGAYHRFVGSGTNETMVPEDFAKARYALRKAQVPMTNLIAIVDPSVEYHLSTMTNLVNLSNNKMWEGVVADGATTGMQFRFNIFGFDVYTSDFLKVNAASETVDGTTAAAGVNNIFFSAERSVIPFVGNMRQSPIVDSEYNKDFQREEYVTTARWGFGFYRPENFVCILTDTDQVYA